MSIGAYIDACAQRHVVIVRDWSLHVERCDDGIIVTALHRYCTFKVKVTVKVKVKFMVQAQATVKFKVRAKVQVKMKVQVQDQASLSELIIELTIDP